MKFSLSKVVTIVLATVLVSTSAQAYTLVSQGLSNGSYSASRQYDAASSASKAFDGNTSTGWNSGVYTAWIEVNLGRLYDISEISLLVEQTPPGRTIDQIWVSNTQIGNNRSNATLAYTLDGNTVDNQLIDLINTSPIQAQYLQVYTTSSPSWVAWREIKVYGDPVPEPSTMLLVGGGLAGLAFRKRRTN